MADIVALPRHSFNEDVVALLERLLTEAKAGDILSIIVVAEMPLDTTQTAWVGCEDLYRVSGAAARMQHMIQHRLDATMEE